MSSILFFIALINAEYTSVADQSALTAYSICLRLETMALFVGMGWGAAASSYVGANLGAGRTRRAKHAGYVAAAYNLAMMLALGALYIRYSDAILGFFDSSPSVLAIGHEYLTIVAFSYAFLGVGVVLSQAMTGAGATLSSLVLDTLTLGGVILPAAYVVAATLDLPRESLFWVIALGNVGSALVYALYYGTGAFLRKQVA